MDKVPNLIYSRADNQIVQNKINWVKSLDNLPPPDFSDFDLDLYLSIERMLPIQTSRGCSWAKCSFCTDWRVQGPIYIEMSKENVVRNLEFLKKKHKTKYFIFHDEELRPSRARELSNIFLDNNINSYFLSLARFEKEFNNKLLELMYKAGFRVLTWGLESGCQRILNLMNKGTFPEVNSNILKDSHNSGMFNICFFLIGFPTETEREVMETVHFLESNNKYIDCVLWDIFKLEENSKVCRNPKYYGIKIKSRKLSHSTLPYYDFETKFGMKRKEAKKLKEKITSKILSGEIKVYNQKFKYWNYNQIETQLLYLAAVGNITKFSKNKLPTFFQQSNHEEHIL